MGDASLVESLIEDDRLLPEELVEWQLTKHKAAAAPCRTGILSRSFSLAELSPRAAGEINRLDVPADSSSLTPLMMAAKLGHCDVVRTLLRRGASPMAQSRDGSTAIDFALHDDELSVEQLLHKLDAAIALVPALFRHSAGEALCYVTMIAARAHIERAQRGFSSPANANQLQGRADRAELLGIELFKTLSVVQRTILLEREPCRATTIPEVGKAKVGRPRGFMARAINKPIQFTLLSEPTVNAAVSFRWHGPLIDSVLNGYVVTPNGDEERVRWPLARVGLLLLAAAVNLLFLPFVALWPPLPGTLIRFLDFGFELVSSHRTPYSVGFERKWSPSSQLYARSLYLLDEPVFQFILERVSQLSLTCALAIYPRSTSSPDTLMQEVHALSYHGILLLWVFAHLLKEIDAFSSTDLFDYAEVLSLASVFVGLLQSTIDLFPFAIVLLSLAQWFRLLSAVSARLCAMCNMVIAMLGDIAEFLAVLLGVVVAFAVGFRSLADAATMDGTNCDALLQPDAAPSMLKKLFMIVLDSGENSIDCLLESAPRGAEAAAMMLLYLVLTVVLLLNMLIAVLGNRFEGMWENQMAIANLETARRMVEFAGEFHVGERYCTPPAPFNLLRLPFSTLVDPGVPGLLRRLWALWAKTREACELVSSFCTGAGSWLRWLIGLPCLAVWVLQRAWANPYRNHAPPEEGLLSSERESTDKYGLDPSNVRYVDGVGQLWSERNTVEKLIKLEEEIERKQAEKQQQHEERGGGN